MVNLVGTSQLTLFKENLVMPNYDAGVSYPSATFSNSNPAFGSKKIPGRQTVNVDDRAVVTPLERRNEFAHLKSVLAKLGWQLRVVLREMQMDLEIENRRLTRTELAQAISSIRNFAEENARLTLQMKKDKILVMIGRYYPDYTLPGFLTDWNSQFARETGLRLTQESLYENDADHPGLDVLLEHLLTIPKSA